MEPPRTPEKILAELQLLSGGYVQFEQGNDLRRNGFAVLLRLSAKRLIEVVRDVLHIEVAIAFSLANTSMVLAYRPSGSLGGADIPFYGGDR